MLLPQHIVCIQYVILLFLFCQQRLLLRTIKETKCTLLTRKSGILCRFNYGLFTQRKCKNRIQLLLYPAFIANNSNFNRNPLRGRNYGLEGGNYCRLNYYLEKNIAVLCYTNWNCLFPLPYHYIIFFTGSFINAIAPDFKPFSLIKRYCPCIFLIYI